MFELIAGAFIVTAGFAALLVLIVAAARWAFRKDGAR